MRRLTPLLALLVLAAIASPAVAYDAGQELKNYSKISERWLGDQANLDYQSEVHIRALSGWFEVANINITDPERNPVSLCAVHYDGCAGDVRMYDWGGKYGVSWAVQWVGRRGSVVSGHVWAPFPKTGSVKQLPGVVIINGSVQAPEELYWYMAETLARRGYVVLTSDPPTQGRSDAFGTGPDMFWNQQNFNSLPLWLEATQDAADFFFSTPDRPYMPARTDGKSYDSKAATPGESKQSSRVASGRANAFNPMFELLDPTRVGIAGHSLGAASVSVVGVQDTRFDAIAAWDNLSAGGGTSPLGASPPLKPRVPAIGFSNDYGLTPTPFTSDPDPQAKNAAFEVYRKAGVDTMQVNTRGGTHYEYSYIPNPAFGATLRGMDMATWYTLAWFDKYVKGDPTADARLLTDRWRADAAEAKVDPDHDGNMYSFYYRTRIAIHVAVGVAKARAGARAAAAAKKKAKARKRRKVRKKARPVPSILFTCEDVRKGCAGLVPAAADGWPGQFAYMRARAQ